MKIRKVVCMLTLSTLLVAGVRLTRNRSTFRTNKCSMNPLKDRLYDFRIMPKDENTIVVSTTDPENFGSFLPENRTEQGRGSSSINTQNTDLLAYLVDNQGCIDFPVLGIIKVMGLTNRECEALIAKNSSPISKSTQRHRAYLQLQVQRIG